jgi:hypothetical protein
LARFDRGVLQREESLRIASRSAPGPDPRVSAAQRAHQEAQRRRVAARRTSVPQKSNDQRDRTFQRSGDAHRPSRFSVVQRRFYGSAVHLQRKANKSLNPRRGKTDDLRGGNQESKKFE